MFFKITIILRKLLCLLHIILNEEAEDREVEQINVRHSFIDNIHLSVTTQTYNALCRVINNDNNSKNHIILCYPFTWFRNGKRLNNVKWRLKSKQSEMLQWIYMLRFLINSDYTASIVDLWSWGFPY